MARRLWMRSRGRKSRVPEGGAVIFFIFFWFFWGLGLG